MQIYTPRTQTCCPQLFPHSLYTLVIHTERKNYRSRPAQLSTRGRWTSRSCNDILLFNLLQNIFHTHCGWGFVANILVNYYYRCIPIMKILVCLYKALQYFCMVQWKMMGEGNVALKTAAPNPFLCTFYLNKICLKQCETIYPLLR